MITQCRRTQPLVPGVVSVDMGSSDLGWGFNAFLIGRNVLQDRYQAFHHRPPCGLSAVADIYM
ncbi:TPA: hypothetical protein H1U49_004642 [Salmonella enterica]|uniref:hypothetical protein n=1 Tax=Hahella sp. HN01 TaxID=2847262 RepID=UPI00128602C5|nr:hypothetical protein [Hahella sp. HN01]EBT5166915.1 hypothetical protein [Salmonella enterica]EHL3802653.1 hypothetical protein [Salmonella enterica subsp. enterica serovar Agona]EBT5167427.1 hypothetical protein [Salmonella enterica]MBU6955178.1 hypothetical protein [Hahella sp. HN01]HAK0176015.1 hypothetical protein [Salmonella enterica]